MRQCEHLTSQTEILVLPGEHLTSQTAILVQPGEYLTLQTSLTLQLEGADGIKNMQKKGRKFVLVASEPLFAVNTRKS